MATLQHALQRVKDQTTQILSAERIANAAGEVGYSFRQRELGPVETLLLFFIQILNGNTACTHLRHLGGMTATAAAYCLARQRLPVELFRRLFQTITDALFANDAAVRLFHGHRVFHMDGTNFSMPDTPDLQKTFGQPSGQRKQCGFPIAHVLALTDAATGMVRDVILSPFRTHDMAVAAKLHSSLRETDLIVADRGFCGYAHFALLIQAGIEVLFRVHQRTLVDFTPGRPHYEGKGEGKGMPRSRWIRAIAKNDQIVEWRRPKQRPRWMGRDEFLGLPEALRLREVRYRIEAKGFRTHQITLATTLLNAQMYPLAELNNLYFQRWQIETNFGHLKTTMGMDALKCQSAAGVEKELLMFLIVYNQVRWIMGLAAEQQGVPPDRISFVDALRWLKDSRDPALLKHLIVNPRRIGRQHPRVKKRRPKQYPLMNRPRQEYSTYCKEASYGLS